MPTNITRVARFGVRQPCCRASRTRDPVRGILLPILVTGMLNVLVPIIELVRHACDPYVWAVMLKEIRACVPAATAST
ncbi:MAG: hypothetical protein D6716_02760 [Chloroflexi bacterium]|nr:MAG: hypothetical protein D6716_02760 [Chloroflexota bacterium]